jgi:uncharacterized protein YgfB (UPF0149 family)
MTAKDVYSEIERAYNGFFNKANGAYGISFYEFEAIKAERDEMIKALTHMAKLGYTCDQMTGAIERANGMTIDEAIKVYEEGEK